MNPSVPIVRSWRKYFTIQQENDEISSKVSLVVQLRDIAHLAEKNKVSTVRVDPYTWVWPPSLFGTFHIPTQLGKLQGGYLNID